MDLKVYASEKRMASHQDNGEKGNRHSEGRRSASLHPFCPLKRQEGRLMERGNDGNEYAIIKQK